VVDGSAIGRMDQVCVCMAGLMALVRVVECADVALRMRLNVRDMAGGVLGVVLSVAEGMSRARRLWSCIKRKAPRRLVLSARMIQLERRDIEGLPCPGPWSACQTSQVQNASSSCTFVTTSFGLIDRRFSVAQVSRSCKYRLRSAAWTGVPSGA
jgi:hypothetical protein